jgi:hypothetical protein
MERYFRFIAGIFLMTALFSCNLSNIEEFQLGANFVNSNAGVVLIDTMLINTSTVRFDSIGTSKLNSLLIGGYANNFTGTVTSNPIFEFTSGSFTLIAKDLLYDSLVVRMKYDSYFIGDTTKLITINVKQLTKLLKANTAGYLCNTSSFPEADNSLGQVQFYPHPKSKSDLYLHLNDELGKVLFNYIVNKNDTVSNATTFQDYFRGMAIVSAENQNQAAVGFAHDSISLRVYYHEVIKEVDSKVKTFFPFPIDGSGIWYNQIKHDPSGSLLATIGQSKNILPSTQTSDLAMVQAGSGIYTKINIPGISYITGFGKNVAFISSRIQLTPLKGSYSATNPLPDSLAVYIADPKNRVLSQLAYPTAKVYANKIVPADLDLLPYYEVDLTPFFTSVLANTGINKNSLLIGAVASQAGKTINPVVFSGTDSKNEIVKMHVYCYIDKSK